LGVVKRHRKDKFLFSHGVDGFSLALDFKVPSRNRRRLVQLTQELNRIVLSGDGRFYFAKDSTMTPESVRAFLGDKKVEAFIKLKEEFDPQGILQSDLYRRCFGR
jgi:decaprenylphospho-beta-D-ribofuranose 2-oxidase